VDSTFAHVNDVHVMGKFPERLTHPDRPKENGPEAYGQSLKPVSESEYRYAFD
jgi:hypothetical protein